MITIRYFLLIVICGISAWAADAPRFDVASIKLCSPTSLPAVTGTRGAGGKINWSAGRLNIECQSVDRLIRDAYIRYQDGKPWQPLMPGRKASPASDRTASQPIKGSPAWIDSDLYTIEAKTEAPAGEEMARGPMMQALLEERFGLKVRREPKDVPVYELRLGGSAAKLQTAREGSCVAFDENHPPPRVALGSIPTASSSPCGLFIPSRGSEGVDVNGVTLGSLCRSLSLLLDRDVIDATGIAGAFDLHLEMRLDQRPGSEGTDGRPAPLDPAALFPAFQTAVRQLGLNLVSARKSANVLVIDRMDRPSQN